MRNFRCLKEKTSEGFYGSFCSLFIRRLFNQFVRNLFYCPIPSEFDGVSLWVVFGDDSTYYCQLYLAQWRRFCQTLSRFYFFLSGPFYRVIDSLWSVVIRLAAGFVEADQPIEIKIDDFIKKKSGKKISPASRYRNAAGSARQEYRVLWGINFVYGIMQVPTAKGQLAVPVGLKVYLKEKVAEQLSQPFLSRSVLARQIIDLVTQTLPHCQIRVTADGGYSTKEFLRNAPQSVKNVGRFPVNSKLYNLPKPVPKGRRGRKPKKRSADWEPGNLNRERGRLEAPSH
jgi:hypothetical protein